MVDEAVGRQVTAPTGQTTTPSGSSSNIAQPWYDDRHVHRFEGKVGTPTSTGCLPWLGRLDNGYGKFWVEGKSWTAHRFAFAIGSGMPDGLHVDHLCRNRSCVNIDHLEAVSIKDNVLRGNGITARAARRAKCPAGHVYDYIDPRGRRGCKTCRRSSVRNWRARIGAGA